MKIILFFFLSKIIKEIFLPGKEFLILKNPVINTIKVYSKREINYKINGDTIFFEGALFENDTIYLEYESIEVDSVYKKNEIKYKEEKEILVKRKEEKKEIGEVSVKGFKEAGFKIEEGNFIVTQSTNIKVSGKIGNDFEVEGVFQDEKIPSSETVSISEFEEAYFNIKSPYFKSKIGEFSLKEEDIERKILGVEGEGKGKISSFKIGTGYGKGIFESVKIDLIPGKNGPYFLGIKEGERIVPGSEKVFLDGKILKPGKDEDYIMDYERGIIIFTPRIDISPSSNLRIDFEKIEGGFDKYYFLTGASQKINNINLNLLYFLERDLQNNPFFSLNDSDRVFLKNLGDKERIVYRKGYEYVGEGKGDYIKKGDTLIYVGKNNGNYVAEFMYVGMNKGNYIFNDLKGHFEYVGEGKGDYIPQKIIYVPFRKNFLKISSIFKEQDFEIFASEFDKNTYSKKMDGDNFGFGFKSKNKFCYKKEDYEGGINILTKYFNKNISFPFRENEPNYEFLWKIKGYEKERFLISPYFIYKNFLKLQNEFGYSKTDSGISKRESYGFEILKGIEFGENYEEIKERKKCFRNQVYLSKKFNNYFFYFKNVFENFESISNSKEFSFGFYNLFLKISENIILKKIYTISPSLNYNFKFKNLFSLNGVFKYLITKNYIKKSKKNYYYNLFFSFSPYEFLNFNLSLMKNQESSYEKNFEYIFVGKGKGNFSYDSLTGVFYPDEDGSYIKKEFFITKDEGAFKREINSRFELFKSFLFLFFTLNREEKNFYEKNLFKNENYSCNLNLELPINTNFYVNFTKSEDREYYLNPLFIYSFESSINFKREINNLTPGLGFSYDYSLEKEESGIKMKKIGNKFLTEIKRDFYKSSLKISLNYGFEKRFSPIYFEKVMHKNYFEFIPSLNFSLFNIDIKNEISFIFQNVKNPFSNISLYEIEKWRMEERISFSKRIKDNFEISLINFLKIGQRTKTKNNFNFNFVAYF
jgi:hypothetical protein